MRRAIVLRFQKVFETKKKRGGVSLLSRVEVSELRLWWTADPPRPFQFYPVPQFSALGPGCGTSTPALFLDVFWPSDSAGLRPLSRRFPELALLITFRFFWLAPSKRSIFRCRSCFRSRSFKAEASPILSTFHQRELFPVCRPGEACASWRLSQGIAFPFRVTLQWHDRRLQSPVWATCSVPREHLFRCPLPPIWPFGGSAVWPAGFI